ncbi:MAG: hypothetical protein MUF19_02475 [Candidatus Pacebacteria bacterium]|jgi:hypothetical protein|nr:hypothetical protein [Candidatus Paceibacterota bacterium]
MNARIRKRLSMKKHLLATVAALGLLVPVLAPTQALATWYTPPDQSASAEANSGSGATNSATATGKHRSARAGDNKWSETDAKANVPSRGWASATADAESGVEGYSEGSYKDRKKGSSENVLDMGTGGNAKATANGWTDKRSYEASVFGGASSEGEATGRHTSTRGSTGSWGYANGGAHASVPGGDSAGAHAGMGSYAENTTTASDDSYASVDNSVGSGASAEASTAD